MDEYIFLTPEETLALCEMSAIELFFIIKKLHDIKRNVILENQRLIAFNKLLSICISQTKRFGVNDLPLDFEGEAITSALYEKWFSFYQNWYDTLDILNKRRVDNLPDKNIIIDELPQGSFNQNLSLE